MKITKNLCNRKIAKGKYFNSQVKKSLPAGIRTFFSRDSELFYLKR